MIWISINIVSQEAIRNHPTVFSGKMISQEAIRNHPTVFRGKSKKTRGLFSYA